MQRTLVLGFLMVSWIASQGFGQQERGISVTGYGEIKTEPDIANRIERIDLATSKEKELKDQVLGLAIANAKQVAGRIATGFDAKLGKVLMVSVKSGGGDARFNVLAAPVFLEAKYQPGVIAVTAEIEVVFALRD